jgi:LacI family transcriptional regulator
MPRIQLLVGLDDAYGRAVARGVIRWAKSQGDWKLYGYGRLLADPYGESPALVPDGLIARIESAEDARAFASSPTPFVDVAGAFPGAGFLEANNDDFLAGRRAGEHLRGLGFRSFAFCAVERVEWSRLRMRGFAEAAGIHVSSLPCFERPLLWWRDRRLDEAELAAWLRSLPAPTALFAANDAAGLKASETCRRAAIAVPDELAVLGVDDEDLLCELAEPSLSSVRLDCEGIGMAAAALLDERLRTLSVSSRTVLVAPREVVERDSTRLVVGDDRLVTLALSWIRANAHRGWGVDELIAALPACRRTVESRFKAGTGTTLSRALSDARLDRAKRLLVSTDLPLDSVAEGSGFGSLQRFHIAFREREGMSPGRWRKGVGDENRRRKPVDSSQ